jgi:flagellar basal body-associated protein FliL
MKNFKVILMLVGALVAIGVALFMMFNSKSKTDGKDTPSNQQEPQSQVGAEESQGGQETGKSETESGERKTP